MPQSKSRVALCYHPDCSNRIPKNEAYTPHTDYHIERYYCSPSCLTAEEL